MAQPVIADDPLALVTPDDELTVGRDDQGRVRISPTDVSQFIRLDQCERYLRLHSSYTALRSAGDTPGVMTSRRGWTSCDVSMFTGRASD